MWRRPNATRAPDWSMLARVGLRSDDALLRFRLKSRPGAHEQALPRAPGRGPRRTARPSTRLPALLAAVGRRHFEPAARARPDRLGDRLRPDGRRHARAR